MTRQELFAGFMVGGLASIAGSNHGSYDWLGIRN